MKRIKGEKVFYDLVNLKDANQMDTPHSNLKRRSRSGSRELEDSSRAVHLTASIDDNLSNSAGNVNYKNVTKETGQNDVELVFKEQLVIDFFIG